MGLIPDGILFTQVISIKWSNPLEDELATYQLVGRVMAYQGEDG